MGMSRTEEVIVKTKEVSVRILSLEPAEVVPWHFHSEVVDNIFCLSGEIVVRLREPEVQIKLGRGQRYEVCEGRVHQVTNGGTTNAQYLLVQGVGKYDFNIV
jgi:quercetin dioxygenase-like cupin family protein